MTNAATVGRCRRHKRKKRGTQSWQRSHKRCGENRGFFYTNNIIFQIQMKRFHKLIYFSPEGMFNFYLTKGVCFFFIVLVHETYFSSLGHDSHYHY